MNYFLRISTLKLTPTNEQNSFPVMKKEIKSGNCVISHKSQERMIQREGQRNLRAKEEGKKKMGKRFRRPIPILGMKPLDSIPKFIEAVDIHH
jgi:hypothetical protein